MALVKEWKIFIDTLEKEFETSFTKDEVIFLDKNFHPPRKKNLKKENEDGKNNKMAK